MALSQKKHIGITTSVPIAAQVDVAAMQMYPRHFRAGRYELLARMNDEGHFGCMVYSGDYQGAGRFSRHWYPVDPVKLTYEERGPVRLDAVYDKGGLLPVDMPSLSHPDVMHYGESKKATFELCGDLQPKTLLMAVPADLDRLTELDNGSGMAVVKAFAGSGGTEVIIGKIARLHRNKDLPPFPLLAQEFIETNTGVAGIADGRHDVRVIVLNGEHIVASVRTPPAGKLLSNTHQGGEMRIFWPSELPGRLRAVVDDIDSRLPQLPRLYSADFMYSQALDKWYLIEINSRPGILALAQGEVCRNFQNKVYDALLALVKNGDTT